MKQYDTVWLRDQEYLVLAAETEEEIIPSGKYRIQERRLLEENGEQVHYTGGLVVARGQNAIPLTEEHPFCYQYDEVMELIFENGYVTALIDHSRAMKRVSKNLEYKLRSLQKSRDVFVIGHFLKKTFVRKYPVKWIHRVK